MTYEEFQKKLGTIVVPSKEQKDRLVNASDSIHYFVILGILRDKDYVITISEEQMISFLDAIKKVEARGAVRDKDFIVCGSAHAKGLTLELHTTDKFFSTEDAKEGDKIL